MDPPRTLYPILRAVVTIEKGRQITKIVFHLFHLETLDDLVDLVLVSKFGPLCSDGFSDRVTSDREGIQ